MKTTTGLHIDLSASTVNGVHLWTYALKHGVNPKNEAAVAKLLGISESDLTQSALLGQALRSSRPVHDLNSPPNEGNVVRLNLSDWSHVGEAYRDDPWCVMVDGSRHTPMRKTRAEAMSDMMEIVAQRSATESERCLCLIYPDNIDKRNMTGV